MKNQIPIYIISLRRLPERRLFMQRQLESLGLECRFVEVDFIDKYKLESQTYRAEIARLLSIDESVLENKWRQIGSVNKKEYRGQLAMILNHVYVYNLMEENNHNIACILEDDATLLPTFPEILEAAPKLSWDILLLVSQPEAPEISDFLLFHIHKDRVHKNKILQFLYSLGSRKAKKNIVTYYGFDNRSYKNQSKYMMAVLREYCYYRCRDLETYRIDKDSDRFTLDLHTLIRLGALPVKSSLKPITDFHYIAEPKTKVYSFTAYLIRQSTAAEYKRKILADNTHVIDTLAWELYRNEQLALRVISPPCATATYSYLLRSARTS